MEWLKRLGAAIDYIEENLDREISYDEVARIACCSTYYFQRIFSYVSGVSLSEYIRRRKMTQGRYYLSFKDGRGVMQNIEIEKVLYDLFNRFELEDISYLNRVSRHIEHSELTENSLNDRVFYKEESLEETVSRCIEYELLHKAISKLPETQRRRLLLYFFGELSYEQIAKLEGCTKMAVKGSVDIALKKLKKLFEKF